VITGALLEVTSRRFAETGSETPLSSQGTKLDKIQVAQLGFDEPRQQGQIDAVHDDSTRGEHGRGIDDRKGYPVEGDGSLECPRHVPGEATHTGVPVHEPDDLIAGEGPLGGDHVFDNGSQGATVQFWST